MFPGCKAGGGLKVDRGLIDNALEVGGRRYDKGISTHSPSTILIQLTEGDRFCGGCGVLDTGNQRSSIRCRILQGETVLLETPVLRHGTPAFEFCFPIEDQEITLSIDDGGDTYDYDQAAWVDLRSE